MSWQPAQLASISVVDGVVAVDHGADADYARPPAKIVYWLGSVQPNNVADGDFWLNNMSADQAVVYDAAAGIFKNAEIAQEAVVISETAPDDTSVLWIDTSENGVLPTTGLTDVSSTVATQGQMLVWDSSNSEWVPTTVGINDFTDVNITSVADKDILRYNSSTGDWENSKESVSIGLAIALGG
jgi:hypothetical protein